MVDGHFKDRGREGFLLVFLAPAGMQMDGQSLPWDGTVRIEATDRSGLSFRRSSA